CELLPFRQQLERLAGCRVVHVEGVEPFEKFGGPRRSFIVSGIGGNRKQPQLLGTGIPAPRQRRASATRELVTLEAGKNLACTRDDQRGEPGQPRDLDAVAPVRTAGDDLPQEDDRILPLAGGDMSV